MTGHVFHPGHDELHGVTVVLETRGARTYVGRFDKQDGAGVHLLNVGVHDAPDTAGGDGVGVPSKDEYIQRTAKFGIQVQHKYVLVPAAEVAKITPLGSLS